ncbi:NAD(P)/FAD-dependent oxidoreductase [Micromonospora sp. NPDC051925]|uniref:NAD(P)/FAD-dependent oxidoreductase n=1 Tax=Micromonospora sp. NPDC051925 TaxID=3364288 RepID=UPI0037C7B95C
MADLLVIGAGLTGSAAALFAARRGHRVTVLDADEPPPAGAAPDADVWSWQRPGVPHARQGHTFLALSTRVLREEAPDVLDALGRRGALLEPLDEDGPDAAVLSRRLVYEGVLRRAAEAEPAVAIHSGVRVSGLCLHGELDGVPRVVGVRTVAGDEIDADLVVDAGGRRSPTARLLAGAGLAIPPDQVQPCGFFYLTRHYRLRPGAAFPTTAVPLVSELDYASAIVFPGDNGTFQLSATVGVSDPLRHRLRDPRVFTRFLRSVPGTAPWIDRGEPVDDPNPMGRIENRWRRLVDGNGRPVVAGLVLLGDAAMQTNPTFGRGTSLGLTHAQRLADVVERLGTNSLGTVVDFETWTADHPGRWFAIQRATDLARFAQLAAGLRGERTARPDDLPNQFVRAMAVLRDEDPDIRRASMRLYHMLMTPQELMSDRTVARRILAHLKEYGVPHPEPEGPDRTAFEAMAAASPGGPVKSFPDLSTNAAGS